MILVFKGAEDIFYVKMLGENSIAKAMELHLEHPKVLLKQMKGLFDDEVFVHDCLYFSKWIALCSNFPVMFAIKFMFFVKEGDC